MSQEDDLRALAKIMDLARLHRRGIICLLGKSELLPVP